MKKVRINNNDITNIVTRTIKSYNTHTNESKIDKIIKSYLIEREDLLLDDTYENTGEFKKTTINSLKHMVDGLEHTVEDLEVIKTTEGDVLVGDDITTEEMLENVILDIESIIDRLKFIKGL